MLRLNEVLIISMILFTHSIWAESSDDSEELDEEFLELLGSFEAEEDDWYDFFWSTVEETEQENTTDVEYE